jgi:gluconate 2-dehydrogenase gamma chain
MNIDRREAIKRTAAIMGGLVFAPSAIGVLNGCTARPGVDWDPEFFSSAQARLVTALSETIIPETDTPGAIDVGVPAFIEEMVFVAYDEDARESFLEGLDDFEEISRESFGNSFADLNGEDQLALAEEQNRLAIENDSDRPGTRFFLVMKELTMMGFFTSEPGAKEVLRYEKVPGRYEGCIPFEEVGRTWAT